MDPARQIAKLAEAVLELLARPVKHALASAGRAPAVVENRQLERGGHQPLLRAVVQVALDPPPLDRRPRPAGATRPTPRASRHSRPHARRARQRRPRDPPHPGASRPDPATWPTGRPTAARRAESDRRPPSGSPAHASARRRRHRPRRSPRSSRDQASAACGPGFPDLVDRSSMPDRHGRRLTVRPRRHHRAHAGVSTRNNVVRCAPSSSPVSRVTAANLRGAVPRATRVATRRSAACSARARSARDRSPLHPRADCSRTPTPGAPDRTTQALDDGHAPARPAPTAAARTRHVVHMRASTAVGGRSAPRAGDRARG